MKIAIGSDFHFEFYDKEEVFNIIDSWMFEKGTDVIVIAGDLSVGAKRVIETLEFITEVHGIEVIYVPGNHEYYKSSFQKENSLFYKNGLNKNKYNILLRNSIIINDVKFCGCMGNIDGSFRDINIYEHGALNDFHLISDFEHHKVYGRREHKILRNQLSDTKNSSNDIKTVVITHTMPSPRCIDIKYVGDNLNACFCNDWSDVIYSFEPDVWICGHSHSRINMMIDETKIQGNPYGYNYENLNWEWVYIDV